MAKIVYALSGQGRGHTSRVMAVSDELRARGHEIVYCCGGTAREILSAEGEPVVPVPPLRQVLEGNKVQFIDTIRSNWDSITNLNGIVADLSDAFADLRPDLVITDFEAFSHRAADRLGIPVLSFNHQQIVTETRYDLPISYRIDLAITEFVVRLIAPSNPEHVLITSFFFPPLKDPSKTTLVAPIIRPAVQSLVPRTGDHVLVYYNSTDGAEHVLQTLRDVDASFIVYNFAKPVDGERYDNVQFKEPCIDEFLEDLATSRSVISTAGFTLISEALFLGKPLLVVPNRGIFEQTLNALFLQRNGLGAAVLDQPLTPEDVTAFLSHQKSYEAKLLDRAASGNKEAIACIEGVLSSKSPRPHPRPALSYEAVGGASAARTLRS